MEISNNLVWVCVLLSMLAIGSICSQEIAEDEGGESELQEMTNFVQLQQGPISEIGEAQVSNYRFVIGNC